MTGVVGSPSAVDEWLPGSIDLLREPDGSVVLRLEGEVDAAVVWAIQARHQQPLPVDAIDAHEVTFIGAHGVELMAQWARVSVAAGRGGVLRRSSRCVDRVLRLTGLDSALARPEGGEQNGAPRGEITAACRYEQGEDSQSAVHAAHRDEGTASDMLAVQVPSPAGDSLAGDVTSDITAQGL